VHDVLMPRIDAAMQSGKIVEWLRKPDAKVAKGEPILLVEGEKTTFEIESPMSGVLMKILSEPGTEVPVGQVVAIIGEPGEKMPEASVVPVAGESGRVQETVPSTMQTEMVGLREIRSSPAARALARQKGLDLAKVKGTGPRGRILIEDVLNAEKATSTPAEKLGKNIRVKEVIPLEGIRKAVAERLAYSFHTTVPVLITTEVDLEAVEQACQQAEVHVSITAFIVKATARALRQHMLLNSSFDSAGIKVYDDINIAVAVHTPAGLTAPVIFGPEELDLAAISKRISELRDMAVSGKLTINELTAGTFTVTNLGGEGVELFAPIINPPQTAILAVGKATKKAVVVEDSVAIRVRATLSLIFDHRVVDGVPAAKFLVEVKRLLENPDSLTEQA